MAGGYMGKLLFIDLGNKEIEEVSLDERTCRDYIGGYGIGAKILYENMKEGADPLGKGNILGFITGPLTGSGAIIGSRFMVVGKSPLTGGWGDANCGGYFGPGLKGAGFDGVFFSGISEKPVYLSIVDGKAEICDAENLWGKDTYETDDYLKSLIGQGAQVACIGPAGEECSLLACIISDKGRAAGRSGLGAVMGSKKLKAIVVKGTENVPVADENMLKELRKKYLPDMKAPFPSELNELGTAGGMEYLVEIGDAGVKNWGGAGLVDFPHPEKIGGKELLKYQKKKYGCFKCPISCGGWVETKDFDGNTHLSHKVQYETMGAFGSMCLNEDLESIILCNDLCNRFGMDTISVGDTIAFAIECYENGILTKDDTDDWAMTWGNGPAIAKMTEKICRREGFGALLADGSKQAAEKIGKCSEKFAIHIGGQEIPMHDPRLFPGLLTTYLTDPTPGRHTQGSEAWLPPDLDLGNIDRNDQTGLGKAHKYMVEFYHAASCAGLCCFGYLNLNVQSLPEFIQGVTGWDVDLDEMLLAGERIANLRQMFNIREGINFLNHPVPNRLLGKPPMTTGPHKDFSLDYDALIFDYLKASDWDLKTAKPSKEKLTSLDLGLD